MVIFTNPRGEIKDVDATLDTSLTPYLLVEADNPFRDWSVAKICCYRVNVAPETITVVVGTTEETYVDDEGNEQIQTVDVTESRETGRYFITMMTPYVDSRLIEHIDRLGMDIEAVTPNVYSSRAYIGDSSVVFRNVEGRNITAFLVTDGGDSIPTQIERLEGTVTVSFDVLSEASTVTISVM